MPTVYNKATGKAVEVIHAIDAKEYVAGGAYSWTDPGKKPVMPIKSEAKPAVIPKVEDKKPVEVKPIVKKAIEDVEKPKPYTRKAIEPIKKIVRK